MKMTREEAIKHGKEQLEIFGGEHREFIELAIKALEQEPILDRIRAQIKDYLKGVEITLDVLAENDPLIPKMEGVKVTLESCLNIIDVADRSEENGKKEDED